MRFVLVALVAAAAVGMAPARPDDSKATVPDGPAIVAARAGSPAAFVMRDRRAGAFFSDGAVTLSLTRGDGRQRWALRWSADAMQGLTPQPRRAMPGSHHELLGPPAAWRTDLTRWGAVSYAGAAGEVLIESRRKALKYTIVAPRACTMRCRYEGADEVRVVDDGAALEVRLADGGVVRESGLVCTQDGRTVRARYADARTDGGYAIEFVDADPDRPVEVDPEINWSQYVGGAGGPFGIDGDVRVAADASNVYATGWTEATDFPVTPGAFDETLDGSGAGEGDCFVMKLDSAGTVVWSTFLGGSVADEPMGIAVDSAGNVYVCGCTTSTDFPIVGGFDSTAGGGWDAFIAKLAPAGDALVWSSYFGASGLDNPIAGIDVDGAGNVYIAGLGSAGLPGTSSGFDSTTDGNDSFVSKIAASGASVLWTSYVGGSGTTDRIESIDVDAAGNVAVTGMTDSSNLLTTAGAFDTTFGGGPAGENYDAFVMKIATSGALVWSTYLGAAGMDTGNAVAIDASGAVYAAGTTKSTGFPVVAAFQPTMASTTQGYAARIDASGASLTWSSYLGGSGTNNLPRKAAVDGSDNLFLAGNTDSADFPGVGSGFQSTYGGSYDGILVKISGASGTPSLAWSSYLGGSGWDMIQGLALSGSAIYVSGTNYGGDFPTVPPSTAPGGFADGFVARVDDVIAVTADSTSLTFSTIEGVNPPAQTVTLTNGGTSSATWAAADDATWLSESPSSGTLAAGATAPMSVAVDVQGLAAGTYNATITAGGFTIAVTLVVGQAQAQAPPPSGGGRDSETRSCSGSAGTGSSALIVLLVLVLAAARR